MRKRNEFLASLIKNYNNSVRMAKTRGIELAEKILEELKVFIPDLTFSLNWKRAGVDIICLFSDQRAGKAFSKNLTQLDVVLNEFISKNLPEQPHFKFSCPLGIIVTSDEARKIWDKLSQK